jgi:hypothetical protein
MNINTCNSADLGTTSSPSHSVPCNRERTCTAWPSSPGTIRITCAGSRLMNRNETKTLYTCKIFVPGPCAYWKTEVSVKTHVWYSYGPDSCSCTPANCPFGYFDDGVQDTM